VGPVWQLEWVATQSGSEDSRPDAEELLVSVSGDGRVVQWTIRKEFKGTSESLCACSDSSLLYFIANVLSGNVSRLFSSCCSNYKEFF